MTTTSWPPRAFDSTATHPTASRPWTRHAPWAAVAIYIAFRVFDAAAAFWLTRFTGDGFLPQTPDGPLSMAAHWDAGWYRAVIEHGYPDEIPRTAAGRPRANTWAFLPLYPRTVQAVMHVTGLSWLTAGLTVTLLCGALGVVLVQKLVAERTGSPELSLWAVTLLCAWPAGPILGVVYAEAAALALVAATLYALHRHWYPLAAVAALAAGFTRPIGLPLLCVVIAHIAHRLWECWHGQQVAGRDLAGLAAAAVGAEVGTFGWLVIAARATGDPTAYTDTQAAWRTSRQFKPGQEWLDRAAWAFGPVGGRVALVAAAAVLAWWLARRASRFVLGLDLTVWVVAYTGYVAAVGASHTSAIRFALLLWPLGVLLAALSPSRAYRVTLVAAFTAAQVGWILLVWLYHATGHLPA